mmetsp:Transcript_7580/g.8597  ORF Transcript_7580/g.8597 Transcript_7580/m.8597 type:complete len:83 (-) Transcript_7580:1596-1844(-)
MGNLTDKNEDVKRTDIPVTAEGKEVVVKYYGPKETAKKDFLVPLTIQIGQTGTHTANVSAQPNGAQAEENSRPTQDGTIRTQ